MQVSYLRVRWCQTLFLPLRVRAWVLECEPSDRPWQRQGLTHVHGREGGTQGKPFILAILDF